MKFEHSKFKFLAGLLFAVGTACISSNLQAQDFPNRPVTIVVPFAPGASNDVFARFLAEALTKEWKQPVVVENRPGASGSIGIARLAKSKPDGYTIAFGSISLAVNPAAIKDLPYDPIADVQPVSMVATGHLIMVTGQRVPMPTVADLVREAKAQKIFYGSSGPGISMFASELFNQNAAIKMENVNYKGGAEALTDVVGGRLDVFVGDALSVSASVADKKATAIATFGSSRLKTMPGVPTIAEAGFPKAEMTVWWGLFAPSGTPKDVLAKINESVMKVMTTPDAIGFLEKSNATPARTTVEEFTKRYRDDVAQFKEIAKAQNIAPN